MGTILQQLVNTEWQPLAFFSKKLSVTESKCGFYDRELLAIYLTVKHFWHMVETHDFYIFTDHKPITSAFQQKPEKCSPRQFRHLDYISQFTTDTRYVSGKQNIVADAHSRVKVLSDTLDYTALAESQREDDEIKTFLTKWHWNTALANSTARHWCLCVLRHYDTDRSTFHHKVFSTCAAFIIVHHLSHPGIKTTTKLVKPWFVWPSIDKERKAEERTQETNDDKLRSGRRVHFSESLQISSCWFRHW